MLTAFDSGSGVEAGGFDSVGVVPGVGVVGAVGAASGSATLRHD
jgi:hypothetical protein